MYPNFPIIFNSDFKPLINKDLENVYARQVTQGYLDKLSIIITLFTQFYSQFLHKKSYITIIKKKKRIILITQEALYVYIYVRILSICLAFNYLYIRPMKMMSCFSSATFRKLVKEFFMFYFSLFLNTGQVWSF